MGKNRMDLTNATTAQCHWSYNDRGIFHKGFLTKFWHDVRFKPSVRAAPVP